MARTLTRSSDEVGFIVAVVHVAWRHLQSMKTTPYPSLRGPLSPAAAGERDKGRVRGIRRNFKVDAQGRCASRISLPKGQTEVTIYFAPLGLTPNSCASLCGS